MWAGRRLTQAAWAASRAKDAYPCAQVWIDRGVDCQELGGDWFGRRVDPPRRIRQLVRQLEALGHGVTLTPAA